MTTSAKTAFRRALSQTEMLDAQGISPFVGLHLRGDDGGIHVRRTSAVGFVVTDGAPPEDDPGWIFVSFSHLQDCLRVIESDEVEVLTLPSGGTLLRSVNAPFETELRVHTVDRRRCGFKFHTPGPEFITMNPEWLNGLNTRPFTLSAPPVILGNRIVLMTNSGIVSWETAYDPKVPAHPRESFLKAVSGMSSGVLSLTEEGFYHSLSDGLHVYIAGHKSAGICAGPMLLPSEESITSFPAPRLIQALESATNLAAPGSNIHLGPHTGVTTKNAYGNTDRFSLGDLPAFPTLALTSKTAKVITDSLKQSFGETIGLQGIADHPDIFRMLRGGCEVSFRVLRTGPGTIIA